MLTMGPWQQPLVRHVGNTVENRTAVAGMTPECSDYLVTRGSDASVLSAHEAQTRGSDASVVNDAQSASSFFAWKWLEFEPVSESMAAYEARTMLENSTKPDIFLPG